MSTDIKNYGFSAIYAISMLMSNLITNCLFGLVGALVGMSYINKRSVK